MSKIRFTFGLDFGTSKTAVSSAQTEALNPQVIDIAIHGDEDRIPTCVLHDTSRNRFYVGGVAEQEYLLVQDPELRSVMAFYSNFKPHIHQSAQHRNMALRFLTEVRRAERLSERFQFAGNEAVVVAGCPVSWMASGGAETLRALLREAGFPPAFTIPEPVGAAFHFLGSQLRAQDFHRDIVVFDWGAGTFDMTVLRAGRMDLEGSKTWGSTVYGGRLFDDLFYQWLLEMAEKRGRHDELKKLSDQPVDRAVLLGLTCRKIKEGFSRHYSSQSSERPWTWTSPLVLGTEEDGINLGNFFVQNIAEFEERMRSYRASDAVQQWLDLSSQEVEAEEAEFINALHKGEPVDLKAWGTRLIETGLKKLDVGEGATAVLTGGSCNWRWFLEHVRSIPPFAGRSMSVLRDDRPELTIARGLARAYAVGSYSKRLVGEVKIKREMLVPLLQSIHGELLEKLSFQLTALIKDDDKLKADLRNILKQGLIRADARPSGGFMDWLRRLLNLALQDPAAEAIRPDLEKLIERWLTENRQRVERWAQRFSLEANTRIMDLLRRHINSEIRGLVEVAIEACGATGQTPFDEALRALGGKVQFEPNMVARVYSEVGRAVRQAYDQYIAKNDQGGASSVDDRAAALTTRFFEAMPAAIRWNILTVQPPDRWAERVIDHLIETLQTLVRIARVDQAEQLILEAA
jgi:molecular chaperone DnaK